MKPGDAPNTVYVFDGSFEGFLCTVYEIYQRKQWPLRIVSRSRQLQLSLLEERVDVITAHNLANRVRQSLAKKTDQKNLRLIHIAFLADEAETPGLIWRYIYKLFSDQSGTWYRNMLDEHVHELIRSARRVKKEVHRFQGFLRFQKTMDGLYVAAIKPDHHIIGLIVPHFQSRFPDVNWLIYDLGRKTGMYYDRCEVREVSFKEEPFDLDTGLIHEMARAMDEDQYRVLWRHYYDSINITERKNLRQMRAYMPKRYWKYLPEKNGSVSF